MTLYKDGTVAADFVGTGMMWLDISTAPDTLRMTSTTYPMPIQIISGGGGTQYAEDVVHSSGATGTLALVVRKDTAAQIADTDGDYTALITDANGRLHVLDANSASIKTAVEVIDNFISGSRGLVTEDNSAAILTSVQLIDDSVATVASAITTKGLAAVGTDGTNARILKTDTGGELQVDVLSVGGTVAVTQSGTWDEIGINDSGNAITIDWAGTAPPIGAGVEATALRVTIATDSTGVLSVDDNGAALTVDNGGTFVVQENGAALTALQLIDDSVATVASAITTKGIAAVGTDGTNARILKTDTSGELQIDVLTIAAGDNNIGNVDIVTVPTDPFGANADAESATGSISAKLRFIAVTGIPITGTVTVGSHAVTNAGTFVVQVDGAALTSLQLIDDAIFVDDSAFTPATSKVAAVGFLADETTTDSVDEGDVGAARMTLDRKIHVSAELESNSMRAGGTSVTPKFKIIDAATSGENTLIAAVVSKKIRVHSLYLVASAAVTVRFEDGAAGTALSGQMQLGANGGFVLPFNPYGWFETSSNTLLNLELSGAISCDGGIQYSEV